MRRARHDRGSHPQHASTRPARTVCLPAHHTALLARVREWRHGRVTQFRREPRSHRPLRPRTSPPQRPPRPSWNRRVQEGGRRPLSWTLRLRPPSWTPWSSTRELPSHRHPGAALTRAPPLPCSAACLSPFLSPAAGRSMLRCRPRPAHSKALLSRARTARIRARAIVYTHMLLADGRTQRHRHRPPRLPTSWRRQPPRRAAQAGSRLPHRPQARTGAGAAATKRERREGGGVVCGGVAARGREAPRRTCTRPGSARRLMLA